MVRSRGKPFALMEFARFTFAEPGTMISQWRNSTRSDAMIGWMAISPSASSGEVSCTRVKRLRFLRWRSIFDMADRYMTSRLTNERLRREKAFVVRENSERPQKVTPSRSWRRREWSAGKYCRA